MRVNKDLSFYRGKKVLITGHTGFKGSWMCQVLLLWGAKITGYALEAPTIPSLYEISGLSGKLESIEGDIRDLEKLKETFKRVQPDIVIHMAAQPLVRKSYINPVYTYNVNVMGTVNVLECVRQCDSVKSFLNITTDKVYRNKEWAWGYRENEELNGFDPYSNSKSCSELITMCFNNSFLKEKGVSISTVRAGNVIGGGDFAADRIIPDCYRAVEAKRNIIVRNPYSIRPYQHVLEPIVVYLVIAMNQYVNMEFSGSYNVGPNDEDCLSTGELVELFCTIWNRKTGENIKWMNQSDGGPHEARCLKLDCSRIKETFKWNPIWNIQETIENTVEWYSIYNRHGDVAQIMNDQIKKYLDRYN